MEEGKKEIRGVLAKKDKEVFWNILKTHGDGKLWKTITSDGKNNTARHEAWKTAAQVFSEYLGRSYTPDQAKQLHKRIKQMKKAEHDRKPIEKQFQKSCSATGGGPGTTPPDMEDGENVENELEEFDPVPTSFNKFVSHGNRGKSSLAVTATPRSSETAITKRKPLKEVFPNSPSLNRGGGKEDMEPPTSFSSMGSGIVFGPAESCVPGMSTGGELFGVPAGSEVLADEAASRTEDTAEIFELNVEVVDPATAFIDGDGDIRIKTVGGIQTVKAVKQTGSGGRKENKGGKVNKSETKKSMNEEAATYYNSMLKLQTKLIEQKMRYYKKKEKTEFLKQKLLEASFRKEGVSISDLDNSDSSSASDSDID